MDLSLNANWKSLSKVLLTSKGHFTWKALFIYINFSHSMLIYIADLICLLMRLILEQGNYFKAKTMLNFVSFKSQTSWIWQYF